jgi:hypothetical protein
MCSRIHRLLAEIQGTITRKRRTKERHKVEATAALMWMDMQARIWMG